MLCEQSKHLQRKKYPASPKCKYIPLYVAGFRVQGTVKHPG